MRMSCCLIGEDSLLIQCGNLLLASSHHIEVIVSPSNIIKEWSKKNHIACVSSIDELHELNLGTIDYIFSIVNSYILSDETLKLSNNGAINYHNSPLPKYAGLNATTWAIINDEKEHGITWHHVSNKLDEGGIVKQRIFPIAKNDTAFTLNLRCYEEAIQAFADIISDIMQGKISLQIQNLNNRSYFGKSHVLPNHGFIDWQKTTAESMERVSRALILGNYDNDVGSLKILLDNHYVIVANLEISRLAYKVNPPGTLLAIEEEAIYVATITDAIKISRFISIAGQSLSVKEIMQQNDIYVGYQFPELDQSMLNECHKIHSEALKGEAFWVNQLKDTSEHAVFGTHGIREDKQLAKLNSITCFDKSNHLDLITKKNTILAAILIYLYRLNNYEKMSVFLLHENHPTLINKCGNLFSSLLPLVVSWHYDISLAGVVRYISKRMKQLEQHNVYLTDLASRHPVLAETVTETGIIIINLTGENFDKHPENTVLYFEYSPESDELQIHHRFDLDYKAGELKEVIANTTQHLTNIINKIQNNSHVLVNGFCFLMEKERQNLLVEWGQGTKWPLPEKTIFTLFEESMLRNPDRNAIVMGEEVISYQKLWTLAEQVASVIRSKQLSSQSLIGIYIHRSIEMLAIILGILKADCVYVPLDIKYPILKIENIIHTADLSHVITSEKVIDKLSTHFDDNTRIHFHIIEEILANQPVIAPNDTNKSNHPLGDKLAYIMFTSGTTGAPKGVMVTQRNVINYCQWFCETTKFNESSIIDFSSSIAFDLSVPCTLAPLMAGGQIAICDDGEKTNPERYLQHILQNNITHTELTPGYLEMLLNYPALIKKLVKLQVLLLGADIVHTEDVQKWLALCPHSQVANEYGPTETTVSSTSYFVNKDAIVNEASVPIGRPAFNSSCYLLDKYGNLCPTGIKGELHIGGAQVTNGYLGKTALTQEKFVLSSFNNHQEVIYKTGDLACWLPDGNLQFFGRNDHQVKIQGYRIELTEIESVLLKMPAIHQAVIIVKQGHYKEKYLRVYLVTDSKYPSMSEMKGFLSSHLPSYMVPKEFCITHAIPLKENEKIDFATLERQDCKFLTFQENLSAELNSFEKITMKVWQHAFNDNAIERHHDFFEIGGNSLLALQIITELKNIHKIDLPLYYLFEYPTISLLSNKIEELTQTGTMTTIAASSAKAIIKLSTGTHETPLFLVHPVGGSIFWYKQLAKYLNGKYTVYGIQDPSINGSDIRFNSLMDMANHYIKEIESVYTGDNYCLGGASFGATVAFEMAHQLQKSNKKIVFLGLFDGWAKYPETLMKDNTAKLLSQRDDSLAIDSEQTDYLSNLEEYRKSLLIKYELSMLNSDVVLFKANELWTSFMQVDDPHNGWQPFIDGKIITHQVPGNHETMFFDPNVSWLAKYLVKLDFSH